MIKHVNFTILTEAAKKAYEDKERAIRLYTESLNYDSIHWRNISPKAMEENPEKFLEFYNEIEDRVGKDTPVVYIWEAVDTISEREKLQHAKVKSRVGFTTPSLRKDYENADVMYIGSKLKNANSRIGQHLIGRNVYKRTNELGIECQNTCLKLSKWYEGRVNLTIIPLYGCSKAGITHVEEHLKDANKFMFGRKEN